MTRCSIHAIHILLRNILLTFSLLFGILFIWLNLGITIDTLFLGKYRVEGLYIKLDKKLIVNAKKITIPKPKASPNVASIDETLERIKYGLTFFESIKINTIHFENNILAIYYHKGIIQIESKDYLIKGMVHRQGNILRAKVPLLYIKEHNISIHGNFNYHLDDESLDIQALYTFAQVSGDFTVQKRGDAISFTLKSEVFTDLKSLLAPLDIPKVIKKWSAEKIQAQSYQITNFQGKGHIQDNTFILDKPSLKAQVLFSKVSIDFQEKIAPIKTSLLTLDYSYNQGLDFSLNNPSYLDKNLSGSTVALKNILNKNIALHLNLKFHTRFDKTIQTLLKSYQLNMPIRQTSGKVKTSVNIVLGLKSDKLILKTDVKLEKGIVKIKNLPLPIVSGSLSYQNAKVRLKNIILKNKNFSGKLNGIVNLKKKKLSASFDAKYIKIASKKENILHIKNRKIPFVLSYANTVSVNIPSFEIDFNYRKNTALLTLNNLKKISPYLSKSIPIQEGGKATLSTKDFKTYRFKGTIKRKECFLYDNKGVCAKKIALSGKITPKNIDFYAFDKRLYYNQSKARITLNSLHIDLKSFLNTNKAIKNEKKSKKQTQNLVILGKNSHIRYENYTLITDSYDVEIQKNGNIKAIASSHGDIIKFSTNKESVSLKALRITDKTLHPLINFDGLKKGRYSLSQTGNPKYLTKGEIIVEGGIMKGFKAYNNTLALINTLPALAMLHKPGYSEEGFTIKSGLIEYRILKGETIFFDSIYIEGESATIVGKGKINLKTNTINISFNIQIARELGKVLGRIPIVGYILVGEDQSTTIGFTLTGRLDKPTVYTTAAKDILSYPIQLIKRTIQAPHRLMENRKK
jgi:hypothetical protein